jgi:acyl-CoA synthetase (NDP forming)
MGHMKNYRQLLKELPSNKVVLAFGQFQPPTAMHELHIKVVKKLAEEQKSDYVIYASKDLKEELLPADKKVQYMNLMFPNTNIKSTDASSIVEAAKELNKRYKNIVVVTSSDLKEDYDKILNKKNKVDFFFETIEVIAAGNKDPEDNKLRESAKKGDYVKFKTGLPSALREIDSRRLMNDMRQGLGLDMVKEEIKLVKDDLREQYFSGKIFNLGDIV